MSTPISRRTALTAMAGAVGSLAAARLPESAMQPQQPQLKGRIKQSACRWCYGNMPLDELCKIAQSVGLVGIDLLGENEWETLRPYGLVCTMANGIGTIPEGWNRLENHDKLARDSERLIPLVAKAGIKNVITFSGNRRGLSDSDGLRNCAEGLKRIMPVAEEHGVTVCMELLNSKRSHADYQCDRTPWGVELCKQVGSERFKLLYDVFHMQIMEGDICDTIKENIQYIGHFHTGGVPGRREIDDTQEIYYPRVCKTIVDSGFQGYLAHEFIPARDPKASLAQAVSLCDV